MKKLMVALAIGVASLVTTADDLYVFSRDGIKKGSGERIIPSQGMEINGDNKVKFLFGLSDVDKAKCGWYKVVPYQGTVESNQYFSCTGYVFSAENGTATRIGVVNTRKTRVKITKYSKLQIYTSACAMGKWDQLNEWMTSTTISNVNIKVAWDNATYLTDKYPLFTAVVEAAKTACGMSDEELKAFLKNCEDGYEYETVD